MVDTETGVLTEKVLKHEGNAVRGFYAALEGPVLVGIEAAGAMQWFLELLEQSGIECRVGHPAKIRAAETRKQKHDRRDAEVILDWLLMKGSFSGDRDAVDRTTGPANLITGPTSMGEDANAMAAYTAGDRTQSCPARRQGAVGCGGATKPTGFNLAKIHRAKTR